MPTAQHQQPSTLKIISGGQTGVDQAALDAALAFGVAIGGWCPKGRRTEAGPLDPRYPLRETPSEAYAQRTSWNVRDSDGTLLLVFDEPTGGTAWTLEEAQRMEKPLLVHRLDVDEIDAAIYWLETHHIQTLNIAGPRASEAPRIYVAARRVVEALLQRIG